MPDVGDAAVSACPQFDDIRFDEGRDVELKGFSGSYRLFAVDDGSDAEPGADIE